MPVDNSTNSELPHTTQYTYSDNGSSVNTVEIFEIRFLKFRSIKKQYYSLQSYIGMPIPICLYILYYYIANALSILRYLQTFRIHITSLQRRSEKDNGTYLISVT